MGEAISLGAQATLPALASLPALLDAAWKAALPAKARLGVGEEAHHANVLADLFAQALEHVGTLPGLVVRPWQACLRRQGIEGEGLLDVRLHPIHQLWVLALPFCDPGCQVLPRLLRVFAVGEASRAPLGQSSSALRGRESKALRRKCHILDTRQHIAWTPTAHCFHTDREAHCLDTQWVVHLCGRVSGPPSCHAPHHATPCPQCGVGAGRDHGTPCSITGRHAPIGGRGDACVAHVACDVMLAR